MLHTVKLAVTVLLVCGLSSGVAATVQDPSQAIWQNADANRFITNVRADGANPPDPFSAPAASAVSGQDVLLTFSLSGPNDDSGFVSWTYDRGTKILKMTAFVSDLTIMNSFEFDGRPAPPLASIRGFTTSSDREVLGRQPRSNAYGATVEVESIRENYLAVGQYMPRGGAPIGGERFGFYEHEERLEPEEARSLTAALRFMALGKISDLPDGRPVVCGSHFLAATVSNPREVFGQTCVLSVRWIGFALVDTRTGAQLKTWG